MQTTLIIFPELTQFIKLQFILEKITSVWVGSLVLNDVQICHSFSAGIDFRRQNLTSIDLEALKYLCINHGVQRVFFNLKSS